MLICEDCVNYFLACSVRSVPRRYGMCELCGQDADCYDIALAEPKIERIPELAGLAGSVREVLRQMYYPDIDVPEGLSLAEYTARKLSGKSAEDYARYMLTKEENENDWEIVVWN